MLFIGPLLCRVYDTIIDNRFKKWNHGNPEQSAQGKQGCPFTVNLLIGYADETDRSIFVGFLDFEKAYDYVNRANLLTKLMDDKCGANFVKALSRMYGESSYAPKVSKNQLGRKIYNEPWRHSREKIIWEFVFVLHFRYAGSFENLTRH